MPEPTDPAAYCTRKPTPGAYLSDGCPDCGHAIVLHIGVNHCPVCETVDLNRQMRANTVTFEQVVSGEKCINDYRAAQGLPPVSVEIHGLREQDIDAAVRRALWRDELRDLRDPGKYFRR